MTASTTISVLKEGMDAVEEVTVTVVKGKILCASKSFGLHHLKMDLYH